MAGAETTDAAQLLEREQELATLAVLRAGATAGAAGVGLIEGAAGIGKSQLLLAARRQATMAGLRVLWARGGELERDFAFGVVRQLFEPVLAGDDGSLIAGAASAARAVFEVAPARDDGADPCANRPCELGGDVLTERLGVDVLRLENFGAQNASWKLPAASDRSAGTDKLRAGTWRRTERRRTGIRQQRG